MTYLSPAKINLFLHITSKRDDGYHNLQTIFQLLDFYDEIDFSLRNDGKINRTSGNEDILISDDLMIKSAKKLKQYSATNFGVDIKIIKKIPTGGGLGGGSSNAATTLVALNKLWNLKLTNTELISIGKDIGADVIATGHNLDDTLQTFVINMLSGDTTKVGWMNPDTSKNYLRKIKPFCEIYESEIVFYAFTNDMPFQSEPCPHMNEGIRTDIREFLNSLENQRSGIKNNLYQSIIKVSKVMKKSNINSKERKYCKKCGSECTGDVCSVCTMVLKLKANQT